MYATAGLTGWRLGPADLTHTGIATHFISSERLLQAEMEIEEHLPIDPAESRKHIKGVLDKHQSLSAENRPDATQCIVRQQQAAIA